MVALLESLTGIDSEPAFALDVDIVVVVVEVLLDASKM